MFELPSERYTAFIFDCDGTLADSMPLHHRAWVSALGANGARFEFTWELFMQRAGMTGALTVIELNRQFGVSLDPTEVAMAQHAGYLELMQGVRPIDEVVAFARRVAARHPISVASGGEPAAVRQTLELIGVADLFEVVVTASDVPNGKPAPDMFLLAAERMGVRPSECCVFEDGELGLVAAERAGMGSVHIVRPRPEE
jgi:HAD superfamily hydrolase (TIGR01509 family)